MSHKQAGWDWTVTPDTAGAYTNEQAAVCLLMDIRAELRAIRARLECSEVLEVPRTLRSIRNALYPSRRKAKGEQ